MVAISSQVLKLSISRNRREGKYIGKMCGQHTHDIFYFGKVTSIANPIGTRKKNKAYALLMKKVKFQDIDYDCPF